MKYLLLGAGAALVGLLPLPIDAYHLIRWIVAGTCVFGAYETFQSTSDDKSKGVLLAIIALVYNPLIPFFLSRGLWLIIDVMAGGFLVWIASTHRPPTINKTQTPPEELATRIDEKLAKIEVKSDDYINQTLITSLILLVFVVVIFFVMRK